MLEDRMDRELLVWTRFCRDIRTVTIRRDVLGDIMELTNNNKIYTLAGSSDWGYEYMATAAGWLADSWSTGWYGSDRLFYALMLRNSKDLPS